MLLFLIIEHSSLFSFFNLNIFQVKIFNVRGYEIIERKIKKRYLLKKKKKNLLIKEKTFLSQIL